jgi:hypothetical protein
MKKLLIIAIALLSFSNTYAQCSDVKNNYEMRLLPTGNNSLKVQMRYSQGLVANAVDILATKDIVLEGLVFAISWPRTSSIKINEVTNNSSNFSLLLDKSAESENAKTVGSDKIVTLYHDDSKSGHYNFDWKNDEWYDLATIGYTGALKADDFFSLVNCDYGLANPNSFDGNSTTDPWFAMRNIAGEILQYSPKMNNERLAQAGKVNVFNVYPNPTSTDLNINIESTVETQAAVVIYDINGRLVKNIVYSLQKGSNTTTIDLRSLVAGIYSVKIADGKSVNYVTNITKQ